MQPIFCCSKGLPILPTSFPVTGEGGGGGAGAAPLHPRCAPMQDGGPCGLDPLSRLRRQLPRRGSLLVRSHAAGFCCGKGLPILPTSFPGTGEGGGGGAGAAPLHPRCAPMQDGWAMRPRPSQSAAPTAPPEGGPFGALPCSFVSTAVGSLFRRFFHQLHRRSQKAPPPGELAAAQRLTERVVLGQVAASAAGRGQKPRRPCRDLPPPSRKK